MLPSNKQSDYGYIDPVQFNDICSKIRATLQANDLLWWQPSEPSILAACEDPQTLLHYKEQSTDRLFPLQQTNQMWFEYMLLSSIKAGKNIKGLYGITESFRDNENKVKRHEARIMNGRFNMFEFEMVGNFEAFLELFIGVLLDLGIKEQHIKPISYQYACEILGKDPSSYILNDDDEVWLNSRVAPCVLLTYFPERTNPFWNMRTNPLTGNAYKCDLILGGMECAGGAERSTDVAMQERRFNSLPQYKEKLYAEFGKDRVLKELDYYFSLLTPDSIRSGCGIGLSRLAVGLDRYKHQTK